MGFLTPDGVLGCLGGKRGVAQTRYRQFVAEGIGTASPGRSVVGQVLLGEQAFVQRATDVVAEKETIQEIPRPRRYAGRPSLAEILDRGRLTTKADRNRGMHQAHIRHGYTLKRIAER